MGCCFSRPQGPNSPCPGAAPAQSGSARAINPPPPARQGTGEGSASPEQRSRRRRRRPLGQHINKPLRRQDWESKPNHRWSRTALDRERVDFFDTRVDGRPEVWQALHAALRVLWDADAAPGIHDSSELEADSSDYHDPSLALATAQSILDAADITLPTGNLADGAYDALGNYYQLPQHIVSDPLNMVPDGLIRDTEDPLKDARDADDDLDDDYEAERRREEKGKAVVDVRSQVPAIVRPSDGSGDLKLRFAKDDTVRSIIRRVADETGHRPTRSIRLVFLGKILNENLPLTAQGWQPGQVLNAFIRSDPAS